jgi:hypothetical protein
MDLFRRRILAVLLSVLCTSVAAQPAPPAELDYGDVYAKGITFAAFLDKAESRRDEWHAHYNDAAVTAEMMTRMRALPERRRLLVVAEDWCGDSVNTVPYLARLVDAAPERLEMRLIDSKAGRRVMEAHRTPDGRAATPTIVVLGEDGRVLGAWTERPAALRAWLDQEKAGASSASSGEALHDRRMKWYAEDAGKATVDETAAILAR